MVLGCKLLQRSLSAIQCVFLTWTYRDDMLPSVLNLRPAVQSMRATLSTCFEGNGVKGGGWGEAADSKSRGNEQQQQGEQQQEEGMFERASDDFETSLACHKQRLQEAWEKRHLLDTFRWALMAAGDSLAEVIGDTAWLALQTNRQAILWRRVAKHMAAAGAHDREVLERYSQGVRHLQSLLLPAGQKRTSAKRVEKTVYGSVELAYSLYQEFGVLRVLGWARGVSLWFPDSVKGALLEEMQHATIVQIVAEVCDAKSKALGLEVPQLLLEVIQTSISAGAKMAGAAESVLPKKVLEEVAAGVPSVLAARQERQRPELYTEGYDQEEEDSFYGLERTAAVGFAGCIARGCCNNARCRNLGGVSEMGLVVGKQGARGVCGGCREACYCSRACQEEAWPLHERYCWRYEKVLKAVYGCSQ